jgi:hypothetical protein
MISIVQVKYTLKLVKPKFSKEKVKLESILNELFQLYGNN